jgi:predicted GH43/DUF377 family glycosyl hydrolase
VRWKKLGRIFVADRHRDWMLTHASNPKAFKLGGDVYRIYFASRDARNRSHIGYLDLDLDKPTEMIRLSSDPVLSPGEAGRFDDCGVIPSCIVNLQGRVALYYIGISLGTTVPASSFCGLAYLNEDLSQAARASPAPIVERSETDPVSGGAAFVHFDEGREIFHMWYESCSGWAASPTALEAKLAIKYATSRDGVHWTRANIVSIPPREGFTYVSTPCVIHEDGRFRMWFSHKVRGHYRIGYAESPDGLGWTVSHDRAEIDVSADGWDSEAVEYPFVFSHKGEHYMLYNGNGYGRTGFGLAKLIGSKPVQNS